MAQKTRVCRECGCEKDLKKDFYKRSGRDDHYLNCKQCHIKKNLKLYEKNLDSRRAYMREYSKRRTAARKEQRHVHG